MDPDTNIFYLEAVQDDLGSGYRLFTNEDAVYELRATEEYESRVYSAEGEWHGKVRFLIDDNTEAYAHLQDFSDMVERFYQDDIDLNNLEFHDHVKSGIPYPVSTEDFSASYCQEHLFTAPLSDEAIKKIARYEGWETSKNAGFLGTVVGGGVGGLVGGLLGTVGGPVGVGVGAIEGASIGAGVGGGLLGVGGVGSGILVSREAQKKVEGQINAEDIAGLSSDKAKKIVNSRNSQHEGFMVDILERQTPIFDTLNERNLLNTLAEESNEYTEEMMERRDTLNRQFNTEDLEYVFDLHFHEFDQLTGVTVAGKHDSYEDAAQFVARVTDINTEPVQPSIFQNPEAIAFMSEHLVESKREQFLDDAWDANTTNAVDGALEQYFPELDEYWMGKLPDEE